MHLVELFIELEDKALTTRVILVRHGISSYNVQKKVQGHCDESTLTEDGQNAARNVGAALQGIAFDAVYSSPLKRARETAELIVSTANIAIPQGLTLTDNLKEINLTIWEGLTFDEVMSQFPDEYRAWRDRPHELKIDLNTSEGTVQFFPVVELFEQAKQFWREILPHHAGQTILVVAHSGINRALICSAIGLSADRHHAFYQSNCGISVLNFSGDLGQPVQLESVNLTAHMGVPLPKLKSDQRGVRLLLVRHGETDWNRQKKFQGQIDVPLNDQGRVQSGQAAAFLQEIAIDRAVSSPMLRPKETAEIILQKHPHITLELDDRLCEIGHGLWEGKLEEEIRAAYPVELEQWQRSPETVQMPEGENLQQVWDRAIAAWQDIVRSTATAEERVPTVLVVAHDAINKAILCHVAGLGPEAFWSFKQGNGAVTVIDYGADPTSLPMIQALNITTHLGGVLDRTAAGAL
ncbi:MAG: histidine phosphatase family protein [Oculatellaceae cyanobacterium bins.114]|nr:histidine phosphatase family protein [Oculatellaceae cyanobacterium bins.114]